MNCGKLNYEEPAKLSLTCLDRLLSSEKDDEVERALLSLVFHDADTDQVLGKIFDLALSDRPAVRGTAILCLGHAARIHKAIPSHPTLEIIKSGLTDANDYVRGHAISAAEDIEMFVPEIGKELRKLNHTK